MDSGAGNDAWSYRNGNRTRYKLVWNDLDYKRCPGLIALDRNYRHLLVTLPRSNQVIVYNANSRGLEGTVEVGQRPYAVVVP